MASETFEQVLSAAQADGSFTPAWKKFVNTKFYVPVIRPAGSADSKAFKLRMSDIMGDGNQSILISELRERVEEHHGSVVASLSGADVVRMLHAEASILVALSDRAFNIAKDRVEWLKKGIEASQARAAAKAREAAGSAAPFPSLTETPAPAIAAAPAAVKAPAPPPAPVTLAKSAPAPAPVRRNAGGPLDVAALKPRNVTVARIGLEYFVPSEWRESSLPTGFRYRDESSGATLEATGFHRPDVSLAKWVGMRLALVQHEMRYLKQDGATYDIDGEGWRDRVKGQATEFVGTFPGEDVESRYLVACIRVDGTLVSIAIRAAADVFEQNRALYKWFLSRVDIKQASAEVYRAPGATGASPEIRELGDEPGVFGMSMEGRIGRLRGMAYSMVVMLPLIALAIAAAIIAPKSMLGIGIVVSIGAIVTLYFSVRLMVLRLHDVNLSGKWILGFLLAIAIGGATRNANFVMIASAIFWIASLVIFLFVPGTDGDNDFGEAPGPNSTLVKVGAGLFIFLQVAGLGAQAQMKGFGDGKVPQVGQERTLVSDGAASFPWTSPDGAMQAEFPVRPAELPIPQIVRDSLNGGSMHQYQAKAAGVVYLVQAIDYGQAPPDVYKALQGLQESVVGTDGELISADPELRFNGHPGRDVRARTANGMLRSARFALAGSRVYMVMTVARDDPASAIRAEEFLDSFVIIR